MQRIVTRILGLDPGLNHTGWGVIDVEGNALRHIACGRINPPSHAQASMGERLTQLFRALQQVIETHQPDEAAVEETFMNNNAASALKLGMARGVVMLAPACANIPVAEYGANLIKKSVSGFGHADKAQLAMMVKMLLPAADLSSPDAADALAVAICHAHHRTHAQLVKEAHA